MWTSPQEDVYFRKMHFERHIWYIWHVGKRIQNSSTYFWWIT
jgi:hypothetical protein